MSRCHFGNEALKSGKEVTPGHSDSVGVPRSLFIILVFEWSTCRKNFSGKDLLENLEDLVNLGISWEKRFSCAHLSKDAADRPHIHARGVLTASEQDFWAAVPQCDDFVGVRSQWHSEGTSEPEICKLEVAFPIDEQILGLQVAVKHTMAVAVSNSLTQLAHEFLDHCIA